MWRLMDWSAFEGGGSDRPGTIVAVIGADTDARTVRSFGAEEPGGPALTSTTPFYVGSVAKQFTGACVALLVDQGRLSLTDPVTRWISELPALHGISLGHLVTHTSGLPDSNLLDRRAGFDVDSAFSTQDRIDSLRDITPEHPPGAVHRYSNHGYVLLAETVARCADTSFGEYARTHLLDPAGMVDSAFHDRARPRVVAGWRNGVERVRVNFTCVGDGGLVTTIDDLTRWDGWLPTSAVAPRVLGARPGVGGRLAHDAWGISLRMHHGQRIESHGGSIDGYLAMFVRFPALRTTFIALANTDEVGAQGFNERVRHFADSTLGGALDRSQPAWNTTHGRAVTAREGQ